jgi:hypothetical protein
MAMDTTRPPGRDSQPGSGHDGRGLGEVLRGCWSVLVLVLTALDALLTALVGIGPLTPKLRELRHVIADQYRAGACGVRDAVVVDDDWIGED